MSLGLGGNFTTELVKNSLSCWIPSNLEEYTTDIIKTLPQPGGTFLRPEGIKNVCGNFYLAASSITSH